MKRLMLLIIVLALGLFLLDRPGANSNPTNPLEYFFDVIMDKTISSSTPAKVVDLKGYKEFSLLARFEGKANQSFDF